MEGIKNQVKEFITENFFVDQVDNLSNSDSLLENGIIDSTGILELVTYLEENFEISIEDDELIPENLDSLNNIEKFVKSK
ncbi:MAG: acyl carrier protein [Calditrichia bacterium]|nr:acyl carrier protein [Calditrichia bacterium]